MSRLRPGHTLKVADDGKPKLISRTRQVKSGRNVITEKPIATAPQNTPSSSTVATGPALHPDPLIASVFGPALQPNWAEYDDIPHHKSKVCPGNIELMTTYSLKTL